MNLTKRNGIIITAVTGVLFGCTAIMACLGSLLGLAAAAGQNPSLYQPAGFLNNGSMICGSLAFISIPVVFYFLLVHGRPDDPAAPVTGPKADKPKVTPATAAKPAEKKPAAKKDSGKKEEEKKPPDKPDDKGDDEGLLKTIVQE